MCRDYITFREFSRKDPKDLRETEKEFLKFSKELQDEMTAEGLKKKYVQDLRADLAKEYGTLEKVKSGWFLSKTNSPEHNTMMKHLKLLGAKLAMPEGKEPQGLTEEELKAVKNSTVDALYNNARRGCYEYGCKKTENGTKGFWHDAGTERFDASMKTLSQLGDLGKKLHLTSPASALRDDIQLQLLQNRKDKNWLKENVEDLAAKSIAAQVLTNRGTPDWQQRSQLEGNALNAKVNSIKSSNAFRQMMKTVDHDKLADAMIKGGTALAEVYQKSAAAAKAAEKGQNAAGIEAKDLAPKKDDPGLSSPVR